MSNNGAKSFTRQTTMLKDLYIQEPYKGDTENELQVRRAR